MATNKFISELGVDIAKLKCEISQIKRKRAKLNTKCLIKKEMGSSKLAAWLDAHRIGNLHVCLEATGTYGEALALFSL